MISTSDFNLPFSYENYVYFPVSVLDEYALHVNVCFHLISRITSWNWLYVVTNNGKLPSMVKLNYMYINILYIGLTRTIQNCLLLQVSFFCRQLSNHTKCATNIVKPFVLKAAAKNKINSLLIRIYNYI